jgi:DNA-binding MarR family transcriptional regulator
MVLLTRLTKQAMRRTNPEDLGLDVRLLMALSFVADHDGAPQQELADALCMDPKNVVLVLNELEAAGHLVRRRDTGDRRRHRVYMTHDGRHTLERATHGFEAVEDEVLQALSPEEREALRELVIRALRGSEPAAACAADTARQTI